MAGLKNDLLLIQNSINGYYFLNVPISDDAEEREWRHFSNPQAAVDYGVGVLKRLLEPDDKAAKLAAAYGKLATLKKDLLEAQKELDELLAACIESNGKPLMQEDIDEIYLLAPVIAEYFTSEDTSLYRLYGKFPALITLSKVRDKDKDGDKDVDLTFSWRRWNIPK